MRYTNPVKWICIEADKKESRQNREKAPTNKKKSMKRPHKKDYDDVD